MSKRGKCLAAIAALLGALVIQPSAAAGAASTSRDAEAASFASSNAFHTGRSISGGYVAGGPAVMANIR